MSLDTVNNDFWQSTARNTLSERCKLIFNQELLSDVKFVIPTSQDGSESKEITAHKFVLAISSPEFYAMFYGELAEILFFGEEKDLLDHCWKVIEKETEEAVKSDGFGTIERSVLEKLIESDSLHIRELELFKAVDRWAEKECEEQGLVAEGSVKRRILGKGIVKGIRFPVMEQKELLDVVLECDLLTKKEAYDLLRYFNSASCSPVGFLEAKRTPKIRLFRFSSLNNNGWEYLDSKYPNRIGFKVDKDVKLYVVRLFGSENEKYSCSVTLLKVYDHEQYKPVTCLAVKTGHFLSKVLKSGTEDYQGFEIRFDSPISLKATTAYEIDAYIINWSSFLVWAG